MLKHHRSDPSTPNRIVVLGAAGFVGSAVTSRATAVGANVLPLGRQEIDLMADGAASALAGKLDISDCLVVISAKAPCKNGHMLEENIRMMNAVCDALAEQPVDHIIYVSSDAVYADSSEPMTEDDPMAPTALHGVMHVAREQMLAEAAKETPLAIVRPTLIYGENDPHNGYGPNRFRRLAQAGEEIVLFGEGEERRDHILVDDVAELVVRCALHRSAGALNAATGTVTSFRTIAETIAGLADGDVAVTGSPRNGPMPHNGYRAFDPAATAQAFPDFRYVDLETGLTGLMK